MKPLPYVLPEHLYSVEVAFPERRGQLPTVPVALPVYLEWRDADSAFAAMSVLRPWECNLTGDGEPERLGGARVSANFFSLLGSGIARGRGFSSDEEQPGHERVVVVSNRLWRARYAADPALVGKAIDINGVSHVVVGIAAESLLVPTGTQLHPLLPFAVSVDIWKPIAPTPGELMNESWDHGLLVRLQPGADLEQGRRQLAALLAARIREQAPASTTRPSVTLIPIRDVYAGKVRQPLLLILGASAVLLLTACVNIANLFLARVASRAPEFSTRIALGAGRGRIVAQTLLETAMLALLGGAIGALLARYGAGLLASYGPGDVKTLADARLNMPVLLFAIGASLGTGLLCGVFPGWHAYRRDVAVALQDGARTSHGGARAARRRQALMGVEMALGTVLLACAALLLHSFINVMHADRGYEVERVLAVDLSLFGQRYASGGGRTAFYHELAGNVREMPGIVATGAISDLPAVSAASGASRTLFHVADTDFHRVVMARPVAMIRSVTAGYFAASGTSLRAGRLLHAGERMPVAMMSESLGRRLWPGESPQAVVGRAVRQGNVTGTPITVVGVVGDVRPGAVDRDAPLLFYRPHEQWASGPMTLIVRTAADPGSLAPAVRAQIRKMDPNLPIPTIRTMREIVSDTVAERRFQLLLISLFAVLALLLGAVGLYGVVSYSVACRTRDIGLRVALGALRTDVMRWVMSSGMRPVIIGLAVGLVAAIAIGRVASSALYEIAPADPLALGAVSLVLLLTSGFACYLSARRAAALDPMKALRHD